VAVHQLEAVEEAAEKYGASIELIDLLTISPMDENCIIKSVTKTGRVVVVQEAVKTLGPASEIIAVINDKALMYLEAPVNRVTNYDVITPYFNREMSFIPSSGRIRRAIKETLEF